MGADVWADLRLGVALLHRFLDQLVERDEEGIGREGETDGRKDGGVEDRGGDEVMVWVKGGWGPRSEEPGDTSSLGSLVFHELGVVYAGSSVGGGVCRERVMGGEEGLVGGKGA